MHPETKYFEHELTLSARSQPAGTKFAARLAYWTFGDPSHPAVLLPTCYGGTLADTLPFLYSNEDPNSSTTEPPPLPASKFFIIIVALLGNGESSSPSNFPSPTWQGPKFPKVTYEDNIKLQHALCQNLGITQLFAYIGFSMGGQQAYHMATLYPDYVSHIVVIASSARTSALNWAFLEGPKNALLAAGDFLDGNYTAPPKQGLKAFSRVYAPWVFSPEWFAQASWKQAGHETLESFFEANWSDGETDANDLLAMLWTWQHGDISRCGENGDGNLSAALGRIKARCLIMPSRTDQYFLAGESRQEVGYLKNGEFSCIDTIWGHAAGGGGGAKEDAEFIKREVKRFLGV